MARWAAASGLEVGALVPLPILWSLAQRWYRDHLSPEWRRRSMAESQAILADVGLTDPFWRLAP